jgi:ankyrin repeat protein
LKQVLASGWARQFLVALCLFGLLLNSGACQVKVGGKTAKEIFPDPQVARLADAAAWGDVDTVNQLLKAGVSADGPGDKNATPLLFAMLGNNAQGVEALLKGGANPNHRIESPTEVGGRAIPLLIVRTKAADLMELLLKYGADPNTKNPPKVKQNDWTVGQTLLYQAVMYKPMVEVLVKHGANVNAESDAGDVPVVSAAGLGQLDGVEFLLDHGAKDLDGVAQELQERPWSKDVEAQRIRILERLRAQGVKIYAARQTPQTPAYLISPGEWKHEPRKTTSHN